MPTVVKDTDMGFKKILRQINLLAKKPYVKSGLMGSTPKKTSSGKGNSLTVVEVGIFHEFGTVRTPERSWLRTTYDRRHTRWAAIVTLLKRKIITGDISIDKALDILGQAIESDIKNTILKQIPDWPPLSAQTIAKKGSTKILIDTAQMVQSIRSVKVMSSWQA